MGLIYCATCKDNSKKYIGKSGTDTLQGKKKLHEKLAARGSQTHFHRALRMHGFASFDWVVLKDGIDLEDIDPWERRFIRKLKTKGPDGYNMTDGGDGASGWCDDVREKHLISTRIANNRPENRAQRSAKMKEKWKDPEFRKKRKEAHTAAMNRPEVKATHATNTRNKWTDPKFREKQTVTRSRPEYKEKVSKSNKEAHAKPGANEKYRRALNKPETRKKKSASLKKAWRKRKTESGVSCLS